MKLLHTYRHCAICHRRRHRHPGTTVRVVRRRGEGERAARGFVFPLVLRPLLKGAARGHARVCLGGVGLGGGVGGNHSRDIPAAGVLPKRTFSPSRAHPKVNLFWTRVWLRSGY